MNDKIYEIEDYLIETGIATKEEIYLVADINGYTIETLNDIIYARTGYRNIQQLRGEDDEEEEDEEEEEA